MRRIFSVVLCVGAGERVGAHVMLSDTAFVDSATVVIFKPKEATTQDELKLSEVEHVAEEL